MKYLTFLSLLLITFFINGKNILNISSPSELYYDLKNTSSGDITTSLQKKIIDYSYIESSDILWSEIIWEIIDLNEKVNFPLYYSSNAISQKRKSLFEILIDAVILNKIKVYDDENFRYPLNLQTIKKRIQNKIVHDILIDKINEGKNITKQDSLEYIDTYTIDTKKVRFIKIKGMCYLDKRLGEMRYRILGLAPMGPDIQTIKHSFNDSNELIDLFWIWYSDIREILSNHVVFNPRNNISSITYDDVLNSRRFNSILYKKENEKINEDIKDYFPNDVNKNIEKSNYILHNIIQTENDMWTY